MSRRSAALSAVLLAAGLLLVVVAVPLVWIDRYLLDTDRVVAALAPLVDDPEVQDEVVARTSAAVEQRVDLPPAAVDLLERQLDRVVAGDRFATVWEEAVRASHATAVRLVRDEGRALGSDDTSVYVDLGAVVATARQALVDAGVPLAASIPDVRAKYVLLDSPEVALAGDVARLADRWATWVVVGAGVLLVLGVVTAPDRGRALVRAGLTAAAAFLLLVVVVALVAPETARPAFDALVAPLRQMCLGAAAAGVVVAVAGYFGMRTTSTISTPSAVR